MKMMSSRSLSSWHIILFQTVIVAIFGQLTGGDISADFFVGPDCRKSQRRESKYEKRKRKLKMFCAQELDAVRSMQHGRLT
jgi:hypothetical protein